MAIHSADHVESNCPRRSAAAPQPLCHVPDGPPAAAAALPGELMVVTTKRRNEGEGGLRQRSGGPFKFLWPVALCACASSGCVMDNWHVLPYTPPPPGAADTMV